MGKRGRDHGEVLLGAQELDELRRRGPRSDENNIAVCHTPGGELADASLCHARIGGSGVHQDVERAREQGRCATSGEGDVALLD